MFDLADDWVWDFWTVDDPHAESGRHHLFFLKAPRSLGDPGRRHLNATIGHAVSDDLVHWTRVADAFDPQPVPAFDDLATWTGSVVRGEDGLWLMFTTGVTGAERGQVQRVGMATSPDLVTWTRSPDHLIESDARWYARGRGTDGEEHWRDPWVVRDESGLWHMYLTAQAPGKRGKGVVGHATSADLREWVVGPPLSVPTGRFDQLEVISLHVVDERWVLMFSCMHPEMPGSDVGSGGVWTVAVDGPGAPVDVSRAVRLTTEHVYVGKLVTPSDGATRFLAFENRREGDDFVGGIIDPCRVAWNDEGTGLRLIDGPTLWRPPPQRSANVYSDPPTRIV